MYNKLTLSCYLEMNSLKVLLIFTIFLIYRVSLSTTSRTCEAVESSKLNKEVLFHVTIFGIIEILIIKIGRTREALDRSSYSTVHRIRHCLPACSEGRDSVPLPVVTAIAIFTFRSGRANVKGLTQVSSRKSL